MPTDKRSLRSLWTYQQATQPSMSDGETWYDSTSGTGYIQLNGELVAVVENAPPDTNMEAWFKVDSGITKDGSDYVSQWDDSSGNNRNFTQPTSASQPLWVDAQISSFPALRFDGSNDILQTGNFSLTQPVTFYMVIKQISWTTNDVLFNCLNSSPYGASVIQRGSSPDLTLYAANNTWVATNSNLSVGTWGIISAIFNGASSRLRINDGTATTGNPGSGGVSFIHLGGWSGATYANLDVSEFLCYSAAHDTTEEVRVRNYLNGKYSIY